MEFGLDILNLILHKFVHGNPTIHAFLLIYFFCMNTFRVITKKMCKVLETELLNGQQIYFYNIWPFYPINKAKQKLLSLLGLIKMLETNVLRIGKTV